MYKKKKKIEHNNLISAFHERYIIIKNNCLFFFKY